MSMHAVSCMSLRRMEHTAEVLELLPAGDVATHCPCTALTSLKVC